MFKPILLLAALAALFGAYAAWPLLSAFAIKQAVHDGDVATLERMVHWAPVRASLKASIAALPPASLALSTHAEADAIGEPHPSLWSRIRAAAAPMMADRVIDTYLTAEGIGKLQQARRGGFLSLLGLPQTPSAPGDDPEKLKKAGALHRFAHFYGKIIHARFQSLSEVEIEIAEQAHAGHHLISRFELSGFEWKLASVRVVPAGLVPYESSPNP